MQIAILPLGGAGREPPVTRPSEPWPGAPSHMVRSLGKLLQAVAGRRAGAGRSAWPCVPVLLPGQSSHSRCHISNTNSAQRR